MMYDALYSLTKSKQELIKFLKKEIKFRKSQSMQKWEEHNREEAFEYQGMLKAYKNVFEFIQKESLK